MMMPDREKVIREIEDALSDDISKAGYIYGLSLVGLKNKALTDVLALLKEQPEIVRCKDCKYCKVIDWDDSNPYYGSCQYFNTHTVDADGFCYKAERKDSD